jgi:ring-1,2-phenylacetyl-CoA epoxidase subunit PaaE
MSAPANTTTSVAFAAAGGIVPALSVANRLLAEAPTHRVWLFYGCPPGEHPGELEELLALKDRHLDRLSLGVVTEREPDESEILSGELNGAKVHVLASKLFDAKQVHQYFVCAPTALAAEVSNALSTLGVEPSRIHVEHFATEDEKGPAADAASNASETQVTFVRDGRRRAFTMHRDRESILDAAARAGIELPFSCKAGVCSTCRTKLVKGKVELAENYALEDWELEQGFILACQAHAKTPEIELTYDET